MRLWGGGLGRGSPRRAPCDSLDDLFPGSGAIGRARLCQPCDLGFVDMGPALVRPRLYRESSSTHILIGSGREVAVGLTSFVARLGLVG